MQWYHIYSTCSDQPHNIPLPPFGWVLPVTDPATEPVGEPLRGQRIVVTRPHEPNDALRERLGELGAEVFQQPAIEICDPVDWTPVDAAIDLRCRYDWLVFSSANGVRGLLRRWGREGCAGRVGRPATGGHRAGHRRGTGAARAAGRPGSGPISGRIAGRRPVASGPAGAVSAGPASRGREVLAERLQAAGATVQQIVVYTSVDVQQADPQIASLLAAGGIDWVTVTSSAVARSLVRLFGVSLRRARLASISPVTSETLRELGYPPAIEARVYTMDGLIAAIRAASPVRAT